MSRTEPSETTAAAGDKLPAPDAPATSSAASPPVDTPAEAEGRRTLSTAFVRLGPEGLLAVELRDGRALLLRDVVMRREDYCGVHASGSTEGRKYCGNYGEIAAARPGREATGDGS